MSILSPEPTAEMLESLAFALYAAAAGAVTVHALLRKADVRAALGWIALAWLTPVFGALIYFAFGINRVTRRATRFGRPAAARDMERTAGAAPPVAPHLTALAETARRVTGTPLTSGNRVTLLRSGDEAYPAMLAAIRSAKRSIALASYIFRNDAIGHAFTGALIEAHQRGVAVRVLLDGVGSGYVMAGALRRLAAGGVAAARFLHSWVPWRMPFLNMRNHKKLLIVDGSTGFTGGLNIGAENSARLTPEGFIDDLHLGIEGPVCAQLMETFAQDWSFTTGESLDSEIWWPQLAPQGEVFARGIRSGPDADLYKLETILGAALAQAKTRVRIVTPYFLPDQRLQFALAQARLRGVEVEILIPQRTDYAFLDWAMRAHLRFFRDLPAAFHVCPAPFDHAKLMTVDGAWCLIGSSNWDTRSLRLNFEFDLECYGAAPTAEADALIDAKIAKGRRLRPEDLMAAPKWAQLRDSAVRLLLPYL